MDSSYFGLENNSERGYSTSCSSSRKGKKRNSVSENYKPKQPQRGLGVAQLENIRLHHHHHHLEDEEDPRIIMQMPYSTAPLPSSFYCSSSSHESHIYGDSHPTNYNPSPRWECDHANTILDPESNITPPFLNLYESQDIELIQKRRSSALGSNSQNSESSENQVLDLELRLSL